ncbi:MAG: cytosolic protein [Sphingobacteriales bacterium]|nr:cytosolic protein [Sphingobacteriales bacterium]
MATLNLKDVTKYVEQNVGTFHAKRLEKLEKLNFREVLKRKNPYLFKAKNILTAQDLVKSLLDAYLQSQEETLFGDFLEGVAIFVCQKVFGGVKSRVLEGIDLEFPKNGNYYIIEIKSGPNWGNSSQIKKMKDNFKNAEKVLLAKDKSLKVIAINGCCYGIENRPNKDGYQKVCGQEFWQLISDSSTLYTDIIEPLGHKAKEKNEEFLKAYAKVVNQFTLKFAQDFCDDGVINWQKIVEFNSKRKPKAAKTMKPKVKKTSAKK